MALPPIIAEAVGAETVKFSAPLASGRKVKLEAVCDPRVLGFDMIANWGSKGWKIDGFLVGKSLINWTISLATPNDFPAMIESWETASGIGNRGMLKAKLALQNAGLVEADFQSFYRLDFREWFIPGSSMTTRRMLSLLDGFSRRTDSLFWSEIADRDPLSRAEILLAQLVGGKDGRPHAFLTSREDRKAKEIEDEKIKRIAARRGDAMQ